MKSRPRRTKPKAMPRPALKAYRGAMDLTGEVLPPPAPKASQAGESESSRKNRPPAHRADRPAESLDLPRRSDSDRGVIKGVRDQKRRPEVSHKNQKGPPASDQRAARPSAATSVESQRQPQHSSEALHIAPLGTLGGAAVQAARSALKAVFEDHRRADHVIAATLRTRRDLAAPDHRFVAQSVFALFRWHGWVDALKIPRLEERLLLSWLLDAPSVHPVCRHWARSIGRDADRLLALGDAPNWTARAEGLKRWIGGRAVNADPWRLFPDWLRHELPAPPGGGPSRGKYLEFLDAMQKRPPLWVRAQTGIGKEIWAELKGLGLNPWVHRQLGHAAKLSTDADVYHLPAYTRGDLEIQDLASQAVGLICDPDPGERWWDACSGAGGKALHLAALMKGRGVVVASDANELRLKEAVRRARRSPYRNISTKLWNGKHVAGKPRSFDGVLVDAPCSAIGTWRRNPDARWTIDRDAINRLAELQGQLLHAASAGVKPGGSLVYSVCTVTPTETMAVVEQFLEGHPDFRLDPFTNPLNGAGSDGTLQIWPQEADSDAMFVARMNRSMASEPARANKSGA
jgi:16S rRNA (cytosine967-C5)-methyltransferase